MAVKKSELYPLLWEAANKLRGGVEPSRYKDYVLTLLFFKYVSDKYKGQPFSEFIVPEGASFDDLIAAKGKSDVGERVDKIIQKFLEVNKLQGSLPDVSFNNREELGSGKELVDKVSGLISIFQNPAMDFKNNRASGDDIIGDAYEYLMMKFAQESGKSKGQFYTPSEVSRIIARLIGLNDIKQTPGKQWTLHDPAAGSGSLLIRAADEAPVDENGNSIITIFGQEKYPDTAGLAKMNFILHNKGTGEIKSGNTLASPAYLDDFGGLKKFDFIVMNPPFSDKDWTDGIKPSEDKYDRFNEYGIPPAKNGDYAWFLHVLKALKPNGKAGIILPHGVLFRVIEESIRKKILDKKYIKGIVGLPGNLFYGTGIPASIIIIDKENANSHEGIFMIDASNGFIKDGNKNRLREQDIEKIVQTFTNNIEIEGYSRFVNYDEILIDNDGNLNLTRYISKIDNELPQNIEAHLKGGIPEEDVNSLEILWEISPTLKDKIFVKNNHNTETYDLKLNPREIEIAISEDENIMEEIEKETNNLFGLWKNEVKDVLQGISSNEIPKNLIRKISFKMLNIFEEAILISNYKAYDILLNYWNDVLQDDVYIIKASGYEAGREIEITYSQKSVKDQSGSTIKIDDTSKMKSFNGVLIPKEILEQVFFKEQLKEIHSLNKQAETINNELLVMLEEESEDEGLLINVLNDKGDAVTKRNLTSRIKFIEEKKYSPTIDDFNDLITLYEEDRKEDMEKYLKKSKNLKNFDLRNKNGSIGITKVRAGLRMANETALIPEIYEEEYNAIILYQNKLNEKDELMKKIKNGQSELDKLVIGKYEELSISEIKDILFNNKWMDKLRDDINESIDHTLNDYASKVVNIAKRYDQTLDAIERQTNDSRRKVKEALERMGYTW